MEALTWFFIAVSAILLVLCFLLAEKLMTMTKQAFYWEEKYLTHMKEDHDYASEREGSDDTSS